MDNFSGLSEEVGASLAARRGELGASLRSIAAAAEVSPSHLSEIENGRSQVSLPVLLRLVRALDLTITDLLPRIGGRRVRTGSLHDLDSASARLSHDELELTIEHHRLTAGESIKIDNPKLDDLLIHVLAGEITVVAADACHALGVGDTLDSERLPQAELTAVSDASVLTAAGSP